MTHRCSLRPFVVAGLLCTPLLMCGCEDASARQRDAVQAQIQQANVKLQRALVSTDASQSLNAVVADLGRIDGGEPGQVAAKSVLAATALREIAAKRLEEAQRIEAGHRVVRAGLMARLNACAGLNETAAALDSITATQERETLSRELEAAKLEAGELAKALDDLDGPITQTALQNAESKKQIDSLRLKVTDLKRRAQELGYADGIDLYRQSVDTSRQADRVEYEMTQREIDLEYSMTPELVMTDALSQQAISMIQSVEAALAGLAEFNRTKSAEVTSIRKQVTDHAALIDASLKEIDTQRDSDLTAAYGDAQSALERAAAQLRTATGQRSLSPDDIQSVKLAMVQVQEMIGRVHLAMARGTGDHLQTLERISAANVPGVAAPKSRIDSVRATHQEAIAQAKAAYETANEQATQVQIRAKPEQMEAISNTLQATLASLEGKSVPASGTGATGAVATTHRQFNTAQELYEFIINLPKTREGMQEFTAVMHATTPQGQRMLTATGNMMIGMAIIDQAMVEKFGKGVFDSLPGGSPLERLRSATKTEETDDRVVYTIDSMGNQSNTVLRLIDGSWKIDVDEADPQEMAMLPMIEQMAAAVSRNAEGIAARIQNDEFTSAEQVLAAFNQAMTGGLGADGLDTE